MNAFTLVDQSSEKHEEITPDLRKSAILKLVFSNEGCKYLLLNIIHWKQSPYHKCASRIEGRGRWWFSLISW